MTTPLSQPAVPVPEHMRAMLGMMHDVELFALRKVIDEVLAKRNSFSDVPDEVMVVASINEPADFGHPFPTVIILNPRTHDDATTLRVAITTDPMPVTARELLGDQYPEDN
jgi:hypothetical protein